MILTNVIHWAGVPLPHKQALDFYFKISYYVDNFLFFNEKEIFYFLNKIFYIWYFVDTSDKL